MYQKPTTYLDNVQSLVNASLLIERESSIDLRGNLSRDDSQNLLSELNEKTIESGVGLLLDVLSVIFAVCHSGVYQFGILGFFGGGENEGRVSCSILGLVFGNGGKISGVANDGLHGAIVSFETVRFELLRRDGNDVGSRRELTVPEAFN